MCYVLHILGKKFLWICPSTSKMHSSTFSSSWAYSFAFLKKNVKLLRTVIISYFDFWLICRFGPLSSSLHQFHKQTFKITISLAESPHEAKYKICVFKVFQLPIWIQ